MQLIGVCGWLVYALHCKSTGQGSAQGHNRVKDHFSVPLNQHPLVLVSPSHAQHTVKYLMTIVTLMYIPLFPVRNYELMALYIVNINTMITSTDPVKRTSIVYAHNAQTFHNHNHLPHCNYMNAHTHTHTEQLLNKQQQQQLLPLNILCPPFAKRKPDSWWHKNTGITQGGSRIVRRMTVVAPGRRTAPQPASNWTHLVPGQLQQAAQAKFTQTNSGAHETTETQSGILASITAKLSEMLWVAMDWHSQIRLTGTTGQGQAIFLITFFTGFSSVLSVSWNTEHWYTVILGFWTKLIMLKYTNKEIITTVVRTSLRMLHLK